ncbi:hypothetical protein EZ449_14605 [Pedobacter frigidisoli]|uniref:Uncharacterized protein n=1 Tax=Pedobacter frigidisoli TaxID=2530455 RepID=A0A4R0P1K7_9SPHI|nr:hypothetical protein [Pedobacter frigidisoli]TCD07020.1 hypothetical protein EZ449_14605 [Pedobacter frigidisoli]
MLKSGYRCQSGLFMQFEVVSKPPKPDQSEMPILHWQKRERGGYNLKATQTAFSKKRLLIKEKPFV